jgi:hypothetical protein
MEVKLGGVLHAVVSSWPEDFWQKEHASAVNFATDRLELSRWSLFDHTIRLFTLVSHPECGRELNDA